MLQNVAGIDENRAGNVLHQRRDVKKSAVGSPVKRQPLGDRTNVVENATKRSFLRKQLPVFDLRPLDPSDSCGFESASDVVPFWEVEPQSLGQECIRLLPVALLSSPADSFVVPSLHCQNEQPEPVDHSHCCSTSSCDSDVCDKITLSCGHFVEISAILTSVERKLADLAYHSDILCPHDECRVVLRDSDLRVRTRQTKNL
jgi:hypothetical protein